MAKTCTQSECDSTAIARGLCAKHYQRLRVSGQLEDRPRTRNCAKCGSEFGVGSFGRVPIYCSERCKDNAHAQRRRAGPRAETCKGCGARIVDRGPQALFCSDKCGTDWRNAQVKSRARTAVRAARKPCRGCGGPLPEDRRANAQYCSHACRIRSRRHEAYGLTKTELDVLLAQHEVCAICGTSNWGAKGPQVDHCHATGRVRGILCTNCNTGLGRFDDDTERLRKAIAYLTG